MRCCTCDKNLSDYESTQRHAETNEFLDMCNKCLVGLNIPTKGRNDLSTTEEYEQDVMDAEEAEWYATKYFQSDVDELS